jgi:phosphate-selective porin OprO/OprP
LQLALLLWNPVVVFFHGKTMMFRPAMLLLAFVYLMSSAAAQIVDPQNVLIQNVHIVSADSNEDDLPVNVLVRDNKLEIVTRDEVSLEDGTVTVDAEGGFLLGALKVGETPSFLILDENPAKNFDVLVDTSPHVVFAVNNGELVKNSLFEVQKSAYEVAKEATTSGWIAYTPPPMALPSGYLDNSKWNKWESKYVDGIFLAAGVLDRINWLSQNNDSEQQVDDLSLEEGGEVRGFRMGAVGTINFPKPWVYTVFGATNAFDKGFEVERQDSFAMFDYRLDIPVFEKMFLSIGKQKEPISMERVMSMVQLPMQERSSVSDAFLPSRNFGVVLSGNALNQNMSWAGGIFNNFIDSKKSIGSTATQLIGRVTWLPYISQDESNLVHLGVGVRHSNGKQGTQFLTEPEFNKSPLFVDTGFLDADDISQLNLEATWRKGPYWLAAEYVSSDVDSPTFGDRSFDGYHITGSWILSGEMRAYNRKSGILGGVPVSKSVYQDGWGAWELGMRYSSLDLTDGLVDGGEMDIWSVGLNWWLSPIFNVNVNYRYIFNDRRGFNGESSGFMSRIMVVLE